MASTKESLVKKKVRAILDAYGAYHFSYVVVGYGASLGIPDIIACYKGRFLGIECKAGGNKPTALQLKQLKAIVELGTGISMVIDEHNQGDLVAVLDEIKVMHDRDIWANKE